MIEIIFGAVMTALTLGLCIYNALEDRHWTPPFRPNRVGEIRDGHVEEIKWTLVRTDDYDGYWRRDFVNWLPIDEALDRIAKSLIEDPENRVKRALLAP